MSLRRVETNVALLFDLCGYIAGEAIEKDKLYSLLPNGGEAFDKETQAKPALQKDRLMKLRGEINNAIADELIPGEIERKGSVRLLDPAFSYINSHKSEQCTVSQLAHLCHISPGYFSRMFFKETGKSYTEFMREKRIEWAKQLLQTTDMRIVDVAGNTGFSDSSHLINAFKKHEHITPAKYRAFFARA